MRYVSDTLLHFLGRSHKEEPGKQLDVFKNIVRLGLKCGHIEMRYGQVGKTYNSAVCFTDIPLAYCDQHTAVYGKFAVGFSKSFIKDSGGNPVHYIVDYYPVQTGKADIIENRGLLYENVTSLFKTALELGELVKDEEFSGLYLKDGRLRYSREEIQSYVNYVYQFFSFQKPMGDLGPPRDGTDSTDEYFKEREWRIVPFVGSKLSKRVSGDEATGLFYKFERKDIRTIITQNREIRKQILDWFSEERGDPLIGQYFLDPPTIFVYDEIQTMW